MLAAFFIDYWFDLVQSIFIVVGFVMAAISLRQDIRSRKVQNLFEIGRSHREIWQVIFSNPKLERILQPNPNLQDQPISPQERRLVLQIIFHLQSVFEAHRARQILPINGLEEDIEQFFSYPIPKTIWERHTKFQNEQFTSYVNHIINPSTCHGP